MISLIVLFAFVSIVIWKHEARKTINVPIGIFVGEKSDIGEVEQTVLDYIAKDVKHTSKTPDAPPKEFTEKFLKENLPYMKDYIIGVKAENNKALVTQGSDISPYGTKFYKLLKSNGKWKVESCFYFKDLAEKEQKELFKKLSDVSNELAKLEPKQVVYQFLSKNLGTNQFGLAIIEGRNDTECKVKVPLKDGRVTEFLLIRSTPDDYSIKPWQVKEYKFMKLSN